MFYVDRVEDAASNGFAERECVAVRTKEEKSFVLFVDEKRQFFDELLAVMTAVCLFESM